MKLVMEIQAEINRLEQEIKALQIKRAGEAKMNNPNRKIILELSTDIMLNMARRDTLRWVIE